MIDNILERVKKIDNTIAWYERRREAVLREDEEYANYLDRYAAMYQDEPLTIQGYYDGLKKLDALYGMVGFPDFFQIASIVELEQRLAI